MKAKSSSSWKRLRAVGGEKPFHPPATCRARGGTGAWGKGEQQPLGCPLQGDTTPSMTPSLPPQGHGKKQPFGEEKWPRRGFVPVQDGAQLEKPCRNHTVGEGIHDALAWLWAAQPPAPSSSQSTPADTAGWGHAPDTVVTPSGDTTESTESLTHTPKPSRAGDTTNQHLCKHSHCCCGRGGNEGGTRGPSCPSLFRCGNPSYTPPPSSPSTSSFSPGQEKIKLQC